MRHDTAREVVFGDTIKLNVVEFNGKAVLETEFVEYDSELRARDLKARDIDEMNFDKCARFDDEYVDGKINFRSVRIFHLAIGEQIHLKIGDEVRAEIMSAYVAKETTKDKIPRRKIHITISNVMRIYRWTRRRVSAPHCLVIACLCGSRLIKEKKIPLTMNHPVPRAQGIQQKICIEKPTVSQTLPCMETL